MATLKEKEHLVDALKGPRYYQLQLGGYGSENAYIKISKEAYDFWYESIENHGDADFVEYLLNYADDCPEYENLEDGVPEYANFLKEGDNAYQWHDAPTEFEHSFGVEYGAAYINISEVDGNDYSATCIRDIVTNEELSDYLENVPQADGEEIELIDFEESEEHDAEYFAQMASSEKGCFFDGYIETVGEFDPLKLKITVTEFPDGSDTVTCIEYDGIALDNDGGDTNGKGYYGSVWSLV